MSNLTGVTSFFPTANEGFATTLGSPGITSGATTIPLAGTTGLTNGSIFVGIIEPGATNQQVFTGTVDTVGSQITGVVWTRGTNVAHTTGVAIVDYVTGTAFNMITTGILKQHTEAGAHTAITNTGGLTTDTLSVTSNTKTGSGVPSTILNNPYKFSVYRSAALTTSSTSMTLIFDTKQFDTSSNYSTTTGLFTAPVAGFYQFQANGGFTTASSGQIFVSLQQTGSSSATANGSIQNSPGGGVNEGHVSQIFQMAANDTMKVVLAQISGATVTVSQQDCYFSGFLVSAT